MPTECPEITTTRSVPIASAASNGALSRIPPSGCRTCALEGQSVTTSRSISAGPDTVSAVTASTSPPSAPRSRSLAAGASPSAIRAGLFTEDRDGFDAAYSAALDEARRSYELAPVHEALEEWRRRAILQSDPEAFRRSVRRAAESATGEPVPDDEPFEVTRANAGM